MITGVQFWNSKAHYFVQTNNPTEEYLRKQGRGNWLVSCGPTAAVGCLAAMGRDVAIRCPGGYAPQPEEVLMDYFNDPRNYDALRRVRAETPPENWKGNEIPQFYTVAVPAVFGVPAKFLWSLDINKIAAQVQSGRAVQICLDKPGHFIAVVAYDEARKELIYNDPWPERFPDKDGFNRRMNLLELMTNIQPYMIVYGEGA